MVEDGTSSSRLGRCEAFNHVWPDGNRSRVPIVQTIESLGGGESSTSNDTEGNDSEHTKERLVGHASRPRGELGTAETNGLSCMGPSLYQWTDDGEYEQWLKDHPNFASDVMTILHVSRVEWKRRQVTRDWEPCEVMTEEEWLQGGLTPWVDDVVKMDAFAVEVDGTLEVEVLPDKSLLEKPLHFKTTSTGITVGEDVKD